MNMNTGAFFKRGLTAAASVCICVFAADSSWAAERLNSDADEILKSMSKFLASTKIFSVQADISNEIVTSEGQKLQMNSYATVLMERPSRFRITRQGKIADAELFFDGKKLTLYGKTINAYMQMDVPGKIDDAIAAVEGRSGMDFPGADMLLSDPYKSLGSGITSSGYYGTTYVHGVECHHLAFRKDQVDWQLWVKAGDQPLPMKYVITTKWTTGAPQYSVQFNDWNIKPNVAADRFTFVAPKGAKKLDSLPVDETGELVAAQESK